MRPGASRALRRASGRRRRAAPVSMRPRAPPRPVLGPRTYGPPRAGAAATMTRRSCFRPARLLETASAANRWWRLCGRARLPPTHPEPHLPPPTDSNPQVRAVVRDPSKYAAAFPQDPRLEVVAGDVTDEASLKRAFEVRGTRALARVCVCEVSCWGLAGRRCGGCCPPGPEGSLPSQRAPEPPVWLPTWRCAPESPRRLPRPWLASLAPSQQITSPRRFATRRAPRACSLRPAGGATGAQRRSTMG